MKKIVVNLAVLLLFASATSVAIAASRSSLTDSVDPMYGVGRSHGSCVPGPCLPHASIYPGPDTLNGGDGGYQPNENIVGFSQLHVQGTGGTTSYGNFLVSPQIGLNIVESGHSSGKSNELAQCDYYRVDLSNYGIRCEVTPAAHSALYRFTFPAATNATIAIDVARKIDGRGMDNGSVTINPATGIISGGGQFSHNWNPASYNLYFSAQLDTLPASVGTWKGSTISEGKSGDTAANQSLGAFAGFSTQSNQIIYLKVAVSFVSAAQASNYLAQEIPAWDFGGLKTNARTAWNQALSAIEIDGASQSQERMFYTALYHSLTEPRDRTGDNPNWASSAPYWDDYYTLWDTWRTLFPLLTIIEPDTVASNINAFIDRHTHDGYVATAFIHGKEMPTGQGGDEVDNIIADAYVKGIPGVNWTNAYAVQQYDATVRRTPDYKTLGYVAKGETTGYDNRMYSGSSTLAFAYNDFCVAEVARGLGYTNDYRRYSQRAGNWTNVWDPTLTDSGFGGFVRGRHHAGGFTTTSANGGYNRDFYEGTCWIYSYFVPQDLPGLIQKMGGKDQFINRLCFALDHNLIDFSNEPSFMTLWWFDWVNRPYLTSFWANKLRQRYDERGCPGDDDSGAMASLYVFLEAGFFPIAGQDVYCLHGARCKCMRFALANGKTFTVVGKNASINNYFIQSATLNGQPLNEPFIHHRDILAGGTLEFTMGPKPSAWGCAGEFSTDKAVQEVGLQAK